jgi:hypothetical protein
MKRKTRYQMARDLVAVAEVLEERPFTDEPTFPSEEHRRLYRDLVRKMEAEATVLPGMGTAVGLIIRNLARDYVVRVIADQTGGFAARAAERDRRMMASFKLLLDQAARSDLEHALRTEFVLGLVTEVMKVLDGEVSDDVLRVRLKELISGSFVTYTESVQGRIGR